MLSTITPQTAYKTAFTGRAILADEHLNKKAYMKTDPQSDLDNLAGNTYNLSSKGFLNRYNDNTMLSIDDYYSVINVPDDPDKLILRKYVFNGLELLLEISRNELKGRHGGTAIFDFIKKIFSKPEDVTQLTQEEMDYYKKQLNKKASDKKYYSK